MPITAANLPFDPFARMVIAPRCPECKAGSVMREHLHNGGVHLTCSVIGCDFALTVQKPTGPVSPATAAPVKEIPVSDTKCRINNADCKGRNYSHDLCRLHFQRWNRYKPDLEQFVADGGPGVREARAKAKADGGADEAPVRKARKAALKVEDTCVCPGFSRVELSSPSQVLLIGTIGRTMHVCDQDGTILASHKVA